MKIKFLLLTVLLFLWGLIYLGGCSSPSFNGNNTGHSAPHITCNHTVYPASLSEGEKELLRVLTDQAFVFEMSIEGEDGRWLNIWMERYLHGEQQDHLIQGAMEVSRDLQGERLYLAIIDHGAGGQYWKLSLSGASYSTVVPSPLEETTGFAWAGAPGGEICEQEPYILLICVASSGPVYTPREEAFAGEAEALKELMQHEEVYILYLQIEYK